MEIVEPQTIEFEPWQDDAQSDLLTEIQVFENKEQDVSLVPSHSEYKFKQSEYQFLDAATSLGLSQNRPCKNLFNAR